jgi:hypothetical protein
MKQCRVSAFARVARFVTLAAAALTWGASALLAQGSTGKIEGRVRDQAGAPIANAQVFVVGTAFNALTNPQGYYFINNVPAGTVAVRAAFIGYKSTQVDGVKVLAGQTITVDVQLEQTAVQIQEITVVTQTQPLVPRDEVATKQRIDGEFIKDLPVDRISSVLALQPGVVAANTSGSTFSIRGGRTQEQVTYIDGVPVTAGYRGDSRVGPLSTEISVGTNALEEASVTTGSSSAEFGNAQSGVISIATRTGGERFTGTVNYETDEPFGVNHSLGFNRVTGSLGGPVAKNLTFFVSGVLEGQQSINTGFDSQKFPIFLQAGIDTTVAVPSTIGSPTSDTTFVNVYNYAVSRGECDTFRNSSNPDIANNYGVDCNGIRVPWSGSSTYQLTGKLNYTFGTGSRVALTALRSQNQGRFFVENSITGQELLTAGSLSDPGNLRAFRNWNNVLTLNWTQNLTRSTERALALDVNLSYQTDRVINGNMTQESELSTRSNFGGFNIKPIHFLFDFDNFPLDDQLVDNYRRNIAGSRRSPYDLENTAQYALVDKWRNNAYGIASTDEFTPVIFPEAGGPAGTNRFANFLRLYRENRYIGKANLDWQFDRYNRLKVGGEYTKYHLDQYSHALDSQAFSDVYREKPYRYDVFVEDRLDLGDVVVVGGVRYDRYDTGARRWAGYPRISTNPAFDPTNPDAFFTNDSLFPKDKAHDYVSPHIQVSFPVTDRTNFRFSYAHQVQTPDFGVSLQGINTDIAITNSNNFYGSDLDFGRTITFEFGIRHAFSDDMVLDVAAYNKDNLSNAAGRLISAPDPLRGIMNNVRIITNADFGNTRGIDVRLDRRFGNFFNGTVAYTYESSKNTGSDPNTYLDFGSRVLNAVSGGNQPPPQAILPTDFDRPHNLAIAAALNFPGDFKRGSVLGSVLQNVGLFTTFRYTSGLPYTPCSPNVGDEEVVSGDAGRANCNRQFPEPLNSSRLPAFKNLDLRLTKAFAIRGLDITGYFEARNFLNFKNIVQVFTTTNDVSNAREEGQNFAADSADFRAEAVASSALLLDGTIDLSFGGASDPRTGCAAWRKQDGTGGAPNCVALIRAEERYGNGDHLFDLTEQRAASDALYNEVRGIHNFTASPRRFRLGFELNF